MNFLPIILRITSIAAAIIAGFLFFSVEGKLKKKDDKQNQLQVSLEQVKNELETSKIEITSLNEQIAQGTNALEKNEIQVEEVRAELSLEKQESQRLQNELVDSEKTISQLNRDVKRLREELINSEGLLVQTSKESEIAQLTDRIKSLLSTNSKLKQEITALKETSLAQPFFVEKTTMDIDSGTFRPYSLKSAKVSDLKEQTKIASLSIPNGLIVLNTTSKLKSKKGEDVELVRDLDVIARIRIVNINGPLTIANILPGAKLENLSEGDTVKIYDGF